MQQAMLVSHILTLLLPLVGAATISKRGVDRGTFELQCKGGEGACNNAAYYINCITKGDNKITYLGPDKKKQDTNRIESGCRAGLRQDGATGGQTGTSTSVCQFPNGMKFIPDPDRLSQTAAEDYQCDEWPPASADQPDYASKTNFNSLRCMKSIENQKLGTQLGTIYGGHRANTAGKKAKMDPGDYFKVTLNTNGADMTKLQYAGANPSCTNDGMQFQMTKRPNNGGLITPGAPAANDNDDEDFTNICVTDEATKDCTTGGKATIKTASGSHSVKGLPQGDVTITRTGGQGTRVDLKFGGVKWDTTSKGTGKGPGGSRGQSTHSWCRELDGSAKVASRSSTTKKTGAAKQPAKQPAPGKSTTGTGNKPATGAAMKYEEYQCYFPC
ncbi:hypothetical protein F5883DRAFT_721148 [Diaporthe sp. PMI_573]|nr:hypothetical protein F5883DRAFT_721148 [Diaporthaceae sp. PMI_573]